MIAAGGLLGPALPLFGAEDPVVGPWHHGTMTTRAAQRAGWSGPAAEDLAWHCLSPDMIGYHPLTRLTLSATRAAARRRAREVLVALHFDDLGSGDQVRAAWDGYTAIAVGCLIGQLQLGDVGGARSSLGVMLHALQDFYSHSTWVDAPDRRGVTWLEADDRARAAEVTTGSYEGPTQPGQKPHGGVGLVIGRGHARPPAILRSRLLARLVAARPHGINLDSRWLAVTGHRARGLQDVASDELFDCAMALAERHTEQLLTAADRIVREHCADLLPEWETVVGGPASPRALRMAQIDDPVLSSIEAFRLLPQHRAGSADDRRYAVMRLRRPAGPRPGSRVAAAGGDLRLVGGLDEAVTTARGWGPGRAFVLTTGWPVVAGILRPDAADRPAADVAPEALGLRSVPQLVPTG